MAPVEPVDRAPILYTASTWSAPASTGCTNSSPVGAIPPRERAGGARCVSVRKPQMLGSRCSSLQARAYVAAVAALYLPAAVASSANSYATQPEKSLAVEVTNASEPVQCAEKDNVTVNLASKEARRFRIEAAHPAYIGTMQRDSFEADWTGCTA